MTDRLKARFIHTFKMFSSRPVDAIQEELEKRLQRFMHAAQELGEQLIQEEDVKVKVKVLRDVKLVDGTQVALVPMRATSGSAGFDLRSAEAGVVPANGRAAFKTALAFEFDDGHEIQMRSRSGLAKKNGIFVLNSPATIDSDFRGELSVLLHNTSHEPFIVSIGDRIAQLVVNALPAVEMVKVDELSTTDRGSGGFGSTGKS